MAASIIFPLATLPDGRKAVVSSPYGAKRALRRSDIGAATFINRCGKLDEPPPLDRDNPCAHRFHLGADITFERASLAKAGQDSPNDDQDDASPNEPGEGFPRHFVPPRHPVVATEAGVVIRSGFANGHFIALLHDEHPVDGGNSTVYVHLDTVEVKRGDTVQAGQRLGTVGAGTNGGRRHLHLDRRRGADKGHRGVLIDPKRYLISAVHIPAPINPAVSAFLLAIFGGVGALIGIAKK